MATHSDEHQIGARQFSTWWRFSAYILEGALIRPARDAVLERYDPFAEVESVRKQRGGGMLERPYLSLIELADTLALDSRSGRASRSLPTPLTWCREHGLLGLLLLDLRQITLYPRWEHPDTWDKDVLPKLRIYVHVSNQWVDRGGSYGSPKALALSSADRKKRKGKIVEKEFRHSAWDKPGVLSRDPETGEFRHTNLAALADYFPEVHPVDREVHDYPMPLTDEFWKQYAEKVDQFSDSARRFARNVRTIGRYQAEETLTPEDRTLVEHAIEDLQVLGADTMPFLSVTTDGKFRQRWAVTSLIGAYARMVLSDAANELLNVCSECGRVFVSSAGRARFCSARCRKRSLQREWRARKTERDDSESEPGC